MNLFNFEKFIKKMKRELWIKSLLCGLSLALLVESLLIFLAKRIPFSLHWMIAISFYLFSSAGLTYLFKKKVFKLNEKKLANRLDQDISSQERVKTMVEFKEQDSPMIRLQREDTNALLEKVDAKQFKIRFSFSNFILGILSFIAFVAVLLVPSKKIIPIAEPSSSESASESDSSSNESSSKNEETSNGGSEESTGQGNGDDNSDSLQDAFDDMKQEVNNNEGLDQEGKDDINNDLDNLEDQLNDSQDNAGEQIDQSKEDINNKLDENITKDEIGEALQNQDTTQEIGENVQNGDTEGTSNSLDDLRDSLKDLTGEDLKNALEDIASDIDQALTESGVDANDPLYQAFDNLSNNLKENASNAIDEDIQNQIDQSFEQAKDEINEALKDQNAIEDLKESLNQKLDDLKDQLGNSGGEPSDTPSDPEDPNGSGQGGGGDGADSGSGEIKYASDDLIYDPNTGNYVKYGDVMSYYYSLVLQGISEGDLPSDLESLINEYFSSLYFDGNN